MTAKYIEEFTAFLGWEVDSSNLAKFDKQVADLDKGIKEIGANFAKAATIAAGFASSLAALITVTNKQTATNANLAKASGISYAGFEAMASITNQLGLGAEAALDPMKQLNARLGAFKRDGNLAPVRDSLKALGLDWKKLKDLTPEDQFVAVLDAARGLEDQQTAVSAAQGLLGEQSGRIVGFLRAQNISLAEMIQKKKELTFLDEEGQAGALEYSRALGQFNSVIGSITAQFSGLAGKALAPLIQKLVKWVALNKTLIKTELKKWVKDAVDIVKRLYDYLVKIVSTLYKVINALGGLESAARLVVFTFLAWQALQFLIWLRNFIIVIRAATAAQIAFNIAAAFWPALILLAAAAIALIAEDLYQFFTGGESLIGRLLEKFKLFWPEVLAVAEEYIAAAIAQWAEWLGVSKKDLDDALIAMTDWLTKFWGNFTNLPALIAEAFGLAWEAISGWFDQVVSGFVGVYNWIVGIWNKIGDVIRGGIADFKLGLQNIPVIGRLFEGGAELAPPAYQTPLTYGPGGAFGAPPTAGGGSVANNSSVKVENKISVTQAPGENGADFANRVAGILEEKAAIAARNNASGVSY